MTISFELFDNKYNKQNIIDNFEEYIYQIQIIDNYGKEEINDIDHY